MTASITRVSVEDDGIDRTTTIVIGEGRSGNGYTAEADSLPPGVRAYLLEWLGAETPVAGDGAGRRDVAGDAPRVGFQVRAEAAAARRKLHSNSYRL
jgi:hypothetical protein